MSLRAKLFLALVATQTGLTALAGPLTPPAGPVTPTGKQLLEMEPRVAVGPANTPGDATTLYKISTPGSYYLTGDVVGVAGKRGIRIDSNDVTIDLNGFTLRGQGSNIGIADRENEESPSIRNFTLRNGTVQSWSDGMNMFLCGSARIERVTFLGNTSNGLSFNGSLLAESCAAYSNGGTGMENQGSGTFVDCVSSFNNTGFRASDAVLTNCAAVNNQSGFDLAQSMARGCVARGNTTYGFGLNSRSTALDCQVVGGGIGVRTYGYVATVERCSISSTSSHGISVEYNDARIVGNSINHCGNSSSTSAIQVNSGTQRNHIEGNSSWDCFRGIIVQGTECMIVGNRVGRLRSSLNTYFVVVGNVVGPIVTPATNVGTVSLAPGSASYAGTFTTTDPNTNISY